jgi:hypothetical protein
LAQKCRRIALRRTAGFAPFRSEPFPIAANAVELTVLDERQLELGHRSKVAKEQPPALLSVAASVVTAASIEPTTGVPTTGVPTTVVTAVAIGPTTIVTAAAIVPTTVVAAVPAIAAVMGYRRAV